MSLPSKMDRRLFCPNLLGRHWRLEQTKAVYFKPVEISTLAYSKSIRAGTWHSDPIRSLLFSSCIEGRFGHSFSTLADLMMVTAANNHRHQVTKIFLLFHKSLGVEAICHEEDSFVLPPTFRVILS
jgi:hypothetical protein